MSLQPNTIPKDGFAGTGMGANYNPQVSTSGANSTTEDVPLGTKVRYRNNATGLFGTCIYLKINSGVGAVSIIAGAPVATLDTGADYYTVTNDNTDHALAGATAICLSIMTSGNYGWFWCGGGCPDLTTLVGSTETRFSAVTCGVDTDLIGGQGFQANADNQVDLSVGGIVAYSVMGTALAAAATTSAMSNLTLIDNWG